MNTTDHDHFVKAVCAQLDACAEQTAPDIATRLDHIRAKTLSAESSQLSTHGNKAFIGEMRHRLTEQSTVPDSVSLRLDAARKQAVSKMHRQQSNLIQVLGARVQYAIDSLISGHLLARPTHMVATACVMVTAVSVFYISLQPTSTYIPEEELALIAATEDFELVENLDFYLWLDENGLLE